MTEAEWLGCGDPQSMLLLLRDNANEAKYLRKHLLFANACCRRIWHLMEDERSRNAVEVAEQHAEGLPEAGDLDAAYYLAHEAYRAAGDDTIEAVIAQIAVNMVVSDVSDMAIAAIEAADVMAHVTVYGMGESDDLPTETTEAAYSTTRSAERAVLCCYLRCIFGNPFRRTSLKRAWLAWNDGTIPKMAQAIYDDRTLDHLPLLADALEDAGCDDADLLSHCRTPGEHVRGCWVVDLLLGKS